MANAALNLNRVIARCPPHSEPLALRLRLESWLSACDLAPPGFPPRAILLIRRLRAPRTARLTGPSPSRVWEAAARAAVTALYQRARRPVKGRLPSDAEAILFLDPSEWLAGLGLATAESGGHWCWREVAGTTLPTAAVLTRQWSEAPRYLPATVRHLDDWGRAAAVLAALSPTQAEALLQILTREFGLPVPQARSATVGTPSFPPSLQAREAPLDPTARFDPAFEPVPPALQFQALAEQPRNRFAHALPASAGWTQLPVPNQRLLVWSLALARAPTLARQPDFASELERWIDKPEAALVSVPLPLAPSSSPIITASLSETAAPDLRARNLAQPSHPPALPFVPEESTAPVASRENIQPTITANSGTPPRDAAPQPPPDPTVIHDWPAGVETVLGGVLYLLNLFPALGLPEIFDRNWRLSQYLSGWGLAELLGRALLAPLDPVEEQDPLWALLAELERRQPGEAPGAGLRADHYRIPDSWLAALPVASWRYVQRAGRLKLWHPLGIPLADLPVHGSIQDALATTSLAPPALEPATVEPMSPVFLQDFQATAWHRTLPPAVCRFGRWVFPYLRWRLHRALDTPDDADLAALLRRRGRICATATHVDLVLPLNAIALPVRRAGLDADPGWVRDLMRVVSFHYL